MSNYRLTKIIENKRNGKILSSDEIKYFVNSVVKSIRPNEQPSDAADRSQIGALLMAIYLKGMNNEETTILTQNMTNSGFIFTWPEEWKHLVVDKHSTGGVGDKTSLVLAPALAALGLKVPMISGRSLGHTGGTLDKLESIPGFSASLSKEKIYDVVDKVGCCIIAQTDDCVPADKVLYQCRDITATITCPPLIVASIVSKKLSEAVSTLVYDVKYGKGSNTKSKEEAREIAKHLIEASKGIKTSVVLTSMENPLGKSIGNSLEVLEAIECLQGNGPSDVIKLTMALGSEILRHVQNTTVEEGEQLILSTIKDGRALEKFYSMIIHQGVSKEIALKVCYEDAASVFSNDLYKIDIQYIGNEGYIQEIDPLVLGNWWKQEFSKSLHPGIGITLEKTVGDKIKSGETWASVYNEKNALQNETMLKLQNSLSVCPNQFKRILIDQRIY